MRIGFTISMSGGVRSGLNLRGWMDEWMNEGCLPPFLPYPQTALRTTHHITSHHITDTDTCTVHITRSSRRDGRETGPLAFRALCNVLYYFVPGYLVRFDSISSHEMISCFFLFFLFFRFPLNDCLFVCLFDYLVILYSRRPPVLDG